MNRYKKQGSNGFSGEICCPKISSRYFVERMKSTTISVKDADRKGNGKL